MILNSSNHQWYAVTNQFRNDFVLKITVQDIIWDEWPLGILKSLFTNHEKIFDLVEKSNRFIPYKNNFQRMITYEIEAKLIEQMRME